MNPLRAHPLLFGPLALAVLAGCGHEEKTECRPYAHKERTAADIRASFKGADFPSSMPSYKLTESKCGALDQISAGNGFCNRTWYLRDGTAIGYREGCDTGKGSCEGEIPGSLSVIEAGVLDRELVRH